MKIRVFRFLILSLILLVFISAKKISFNVLAPAPVYIPTYIKTVALIDRSLPGNKNLNILEGILTGEGPNQDKLATQFAIDGLNNLLLNNSRFGVIRTQEKFMGSESGKNFADTLPWDTIKELCSKYNVDAIVALETYDSDFIITNGSRLVDKRLGNRTIKVPEFYANGVAKIYLGFRFYNPREQTVVDQFQYAHSMDWSVGGSSIPAAIEGLLNRNEALKEVSYNAGVIYGERISPAWYRVTREYFHKSKGDHDLAEGARMMEANDWERAIAALEKAEELGHNLAVVYEILGDLNLAKEWASTAWGKYKNKKSRDYGYILTRRIQEQERLQQQLEE